MRITLRGAGDSGQVDELRIVPHVQGVLSRIQKRQKP